MQATGSAAIRAGRLVDVEAGAALADDLPDQTDSRLPGTCAELRYRNRQTRTSDPLRPRRKVAEPGHLNTVLDS